MRLEILGDIRGIETSTTGRGVHIRRHLDRTYGKRRWRKGKGTATVELGFASIESPEVARQALTVAEITP